ncbi:MAG TPA: 5-dehydro-4-deoxy-D-glucuronate isomerase [Candidatus Dormibacteraeota bacterium]|nr:5-dehydro-4-deoxy-D-glucuronate isomerase [Candidatus Dormibacteraeota bacterium]
MEIRFSPNQKDYQGLDTVGLRQAFLVESLFKPGLQFLYSDADRAVVGSAVPGNTPLALTADPELRASYFCERREMGILNVGGAGSVEADGKKYEMGKLDSLYLGRGTQNVTFATANPSDPGAYYLLSYPAHAQYPAAQVRKSEITPVEIGAAADANRRSIYKCIHMAGIKSCQLVMGYTLLQEGAVWNTMPPHTHTRRSEIYLYFDLGPKRRVMHFMGTPQQTRHIVMADRQAVISPGWSIHSGCGTGAYAFCWGMGGENQAYDDMDPAPLEALR